jgi:hypothetical protein
MRLLFVILLFCLETIAAPAQALQHLQLKIPDRVDRLFAQIKADSNYISYVNLQQEAVNAGKKYMDSLAKQGIERPNIYKDSTGEHAPFIAATSRKLQAALQLKSLVAKQYPLLSELSYSEENKLKRLSLDYYQQPQQ